MPNKRNSTSRLSPSQLLLVLAVFLIFAAVEIWTQRSNPTSPSQVNPTANIPTLPNPPTRNPGGTVSHSAAITPAPLDFPALESLNDFDYFLLALSWSPDYCATSGGNDPQQCSIGRKLGFVLHGLWPQYNQGYPSNCSTEKLTETVKDQFPGLYPSQSLYDHEWEKHGTCTGLPATAYLSLSKGVKESITIPSAYRSPEAPFRVTVKQVKQEFSTANPGFSGDSFAVNCSSNGRYLKELYVCFSREGKPAACGADVQKDAQKSCQNPDFLVRNIR